MEEDAPKSSLRKNLLWIFLALITVPVLLAVIWRSVDNSATAKIQAAIARNHEPLTLAELAARYPPIPDNQNAASALLDLWESEQGEFWAQFRRGESLNAPFVSPPVDPGVPLIGANSLHVPLGQPLDPELLAAGEAYLAQQQAHIEALQIALSRPHSRFPLQFANGSLMVLPHLSRIRREAQNLQLQALVALEHGDSSAAVRALEVGASVGQLLASEPILISQLVRIAVDRLELDGLERLLSRQPLSTSQLRELDAVVRRMELHGVLREALIGERAFLFDRLNSGDAFGMGDFEGEAKGGTQLGTQVLELTGLLPSDRRLAMDTFTKAIALLEHESPSALEEYQKLIDAASAEAGRFPPKILSKAILPAFSKTAEKFAAYEARRRSALTAVAIESFRVANQGRSPEQLEELVPNYLASLPEDPFDGHSLRYKRTATGYIVYSVGADRIDGGGAGPTSQGSSVKPGADETFKVER